MVDTVNIYITIDTDNYITGWSTSKNPNDNSEIELSVATDNIIFTHPAYTSMKFLNGKIFFDEEKYFRICKLNAKDRLERECVQDMNSTLVFDDVIYPNSLEDQKVYQEIANKYYLFETDTVTITGKSENGEIVKTTFTKGEYLTFFSYSLLIKEYKQKILTDFYFPLVDAAQSSEELDKIHYDSKPKEDFPLPEKPIIDLDGDGKISQEEFDALVKENKELKQKVELNEMALVDAINMLSSMIVGQS